MSTLLPRQILSVNTALATPLEIDGRRVLSGIGKRAVSTPAPRYPADALRSGTSGEVLVELSIGTAGSVTDARVLRATPARTFDREALNAVKRWKFEPISSPTTTRRTLAFAPNK